MRDLYKYNSTKAWKEYYAEKAKGFPYSGSAAFKLNDGCREYPRNSKLDEPGSSFIPYWIALELIHEGKKDSLNVTLDELLEKCKQNYDIEVKRLERFKDRAEKYKNHPLNWKLFRPYDTDYNDFDTATFKCEIPERLSDEECKDLKEELWEYFYNPHDDGRDCSGVWFTSWIKVLRCSNKTVIYHRKSCDV